MARQVNFLKIIQPQTDPFPEEAATLVGTEEIVVEVGEFIFEGDIAIRI